MERVYLLLAFICLLNESFLIIRFEKYGSELGINGARLCYEKYIIYISQSF